VIVMIPFFVNADTFRPRFRMSSPVPWGAKSPRRHQLSLLTGSLVAETFPSPTIPPFPPRLFLEARELRIGVQFGPLIFHRSVQITTFSVDSPSIHLITRRMARGTSPRWAAPVRNLHPSRRAPASLTVSELKIENGSAVLSSAPAAGNPSQCTDVN